MQINHVEHVCSRGFHAGSVLVVVSDDFHPGLRHQSLDAQKRRNYHQNQNLRTRHFASGVWGSAVTDVQ